MQEMTSLQFRKMRNEKRMFFTLTGARNRSMRAMTTLTLPLSLIALGKYSSSFVLLPSEESKFEECVKVCYSASFRESDPSSPATPVQIVSPAMATTSANGKRPGEPLKDSACSQPVHKSVRYNDSCSKLKYSCHS
jgi:hypothetical protein